MLGGRGRSLALSQVQCHHGLYHEIRRPLGSVYNDASRDPPKDHTTVVSPAAVQERVLAKYDGSPGVYRPPLHSTYDYVFIGGGHNALTAAAYVRKETGKSCLVLERRNMVGGAAVTEELVPGFKFSRASYLAGLLRPSVVTDLELGPRLKFIARDPSSFTPTTLDGPHKGKCLVLGSNMKDNQASIAQFSSADAAAYPRYEEFLHSCRTLVGPLLNHSLPGTTLKETLMSSAALVRAGWNNARTLVPLYELLTTPASALLDRWFESDVLKTTLACDAIIGAMTAPSLQGSGYVLLHHVMGESPSGPGSWCLVEGGMGSISAAIAAVASSRGVETAVNATVKRIVYSSSSNGNVRASGVELADGSIIRATRAVVSGVTPYHTFMELSDLNGVLPQGSEAKRRLSEFGTHIKFADYSSGVFKINCAVSKLPNFAAWPNVGEAAGPQHRGTIHLEESMKELEAGYDEARRGIPATKPVIEMTIPSALDPTLAPPGKHVVQFFIQYAPYDVDPRLGSWHDPAFKEAFVQRVFSIVDKYAPGFSASVIGVDALSPLDLERIFGLHRGNIFHGAMSLHQLGFARPAPHYSDYRTPIEGLYMCGAGTHPGGGVMGASGRNCAQALISDA